MPLDGTRPHDHHLDHRIVVVARAQARQQGHPGARFDLEHAHRVGPPEHRVDLGVLGRDAGQGPRTPRLLLFADYDGVGLHNYARLRERVGEQAGFWLMPDWRSRLERFGNPDIWRKTLGDFQAAQPYLDDPSVSEAVRALVDTLRRKGLALEQEAVWL